MLRVYTKETLFSMHGEYMIKVQEGRVRQLMLGCVTNWETEQESGYKSKCYVNKEWVSIFVSEWGSKCAR